MPYSFAFRSGGTATVNCDDVSSMSLTTVDFVAKDKGICLTISDDTQEWQYIQGPNSEAVVVIDKRFAVTKDEEGETVFGNIRVTGNEVE